MCMNIDFKVPPKYYLTCLVVILNESQMELSINNKLKIKTTFVTNEREMEWSAFCPFAANYIQLRLGAVVVGLRYAMEFLFRDCGINPVLPRPQLGPQSQLFHPDKCDREKVTRTRFAYLVCPRRFSFSSSSTQY
jgi:hypothetical protein